MPERDLAGLRFRVDTHTVCSAPDGTVKWEADTEPAYVTFERLNPELRRQILADRGPREANRGRDQ